MIRLCEVAPELIRQREAKSSHPYHTTRKEGKGLALSIVRKSMEAHGGSVETLDNAEKGVLFRVPFPMGS